LAARHLEHVRQVYRDVFGFREPDCDTAAPNPGP
jgi:hypothetical protein